MAKKRKAPSRRRSQGRPLGATKIEIRSLIYIPGGRGPHPVLCFLHGAGEAATDDKGSAQTLAKILDNRSPAWHAEHGSAFISRFLVICPQLESRRRWEKSDARLIDAIVRVAIADHRGDASQLVLTGFSYGGEGAFQIAHESALNWSTIWAVDPALQRMPPIPAPRVRVWVHYGRQQPGAANMEAFAEALDLQPWSGDRAARHMVTSLDTDHPETCIRAYEEKRVYNWLLR